MGCTKRVGLFHSDRSKLQKAGATTHNRRRASKASLPTLSKDTKKQVRGWRSLKLVLSGPHQLPFLTRPGTPAVLFRCWRQCFIMFSSLMICQVKPSPCPFIGPFI